MERFRCVDPGMWYGMRCDQQGRHSDVKAYLRMTRLLCVKKMNWPLASFVTMSTRTSRNPLACQLGWACQHGASCKQPWEEVQLEQFMFRLGLQHRVTRHARDLNWAYRVWRHVQSLWACLRPPSW